MSDLINRQAAFDALDNIASDLHMRKRYDEEYIASWCAEIVEQLPSAEPEIITCENCKYGDAKPIADGRRWCSLHSDYMYYCSDAERRTDE